MSAIATTETTTTTAITVASTAKENKNDNGKMVTTTEATKKKNGGMNLLRVALFMIRRKSSNGKSKSVQVDVASKGMWKKLVGSMRPLHLHHNNGGSPPQVITTAAAPDSPAAIIEQYEDVFPPPMSPQGPYSPSSSASCDDGMSSRYASAMNLQELDKSDDCDAEIKACGEDFMIDSKAEEFIAHFYHQMRLQRLDSMNTRYNEMIARGLR